MKPTTAKGPVATRDGQRSELEDEAAAGAAGFQGPVRVRRLIGRERLRHPQRDLARLDLLAEPVQLGLRSGQAELAWGSGLGAVRPWR